MTTLTERLQQEDQEWIVFRRPSTCILRFEAQRSDGFRERLQEIDIDIIIAHTIAETLAAVEAGVPEVPNSKCLSTVCDHYHGVDRDIEMYRSKVLAHIATLKTNQK